MNSENVKLGWGPFAAGALLLANVVVPLVWGDVYPFTSAPMFRDNPRHCCNYRLFAPSGEELAAEAWQCQRIYDGNPLGYGVGLKPPPVIEQQFGEIHNEDLVREHVQQILNRPEHTKLAYVEVVQEEIGPIDDERVGIVRARQIRVRRDNSN